MNYQEFKKVLEQEGVTPESLNSHDEEKLVYYAYCVGVDEETIKIDSRASDEDIARVEEALEASLPSDYVLFLKEFGPNFRYLFWKEFYSAKPQEHCESDLVVSFLDYRPEMKGYFVAIAPCDDETAFDIGWYGFVIENGICDPTLCWLDPDTHEPSRLLNWHYAGDVFELLLECFHRDYTWITTDND